MGQKQERRFQVRYLVLLCLLAAGGVVAFISMRPSPEPVTPSQAVKSHDFQAIGAEISQKATLNASEKHKVIESRVIKTEFQFNAIAPHWKETNATDENRKFEMRASLDEKQWSPWLEIEAVGPLRDDDPYPDRMFAETPILVDGRYFQYRISLSRESLERPPPDIYDLKINHIDSRRPAQRTGMIDKIKQVFKGGKTYAAQQHPRVITRSEWGSPDPYGEYFKGTDKHWRPTHKPVKQIFIHHTVTANYQADPSAAVRAVWDFHANTRGWGDIGYNYLVDHLGNVYQGRLGGDNAVGGHVLGYNQGSLGVSLLGCFDSQNETCLQLNGGVSPPPTQMVNGLTSLLSNKATSFEIDPWGSNLMCDSNNQNCLNLPTITGHRDANDTTCPGNLTVNMLQNIRDTTRAKNIEGWTYSAKQLSYDTVDLSANSSANVTVRFKNTGANTWTNTDNKMTLYTMEPPGRISLFEGTGWLSSSKPALINETSVDPGQTGSFTFNVKRPNLPPGVYKEAYTLISQDGNTPGSFYNLNFQLGCTIGKASNPRANGSLIRNVADGRTYLIEGGKKHYIHSVLAAYSEGINLNYTVDVDSQEISLLTDGEPVRLREGSLIKSVDSTKVYIVDLTPGGYQKRWVSSGQAMDAFGLKADQIHPISQSFIDSYPEGASLEPTSLAPDGRLIKASNDHRVYITEDGKKRWITSAFIFNSHVFQPQHVGVISPAKVTELPDGSRVLLRAGTIMKASDSGNLYISDLVNNIEYRRPITSMHAFYASGFRTELITNISQEAVNSYAIGDNVECYK